ncbi:hypothetical protein BD65_1294 [Yersinia ruckeri]|nr:hypothetical protein BD65_1294 [Yersinia ruckeri]
MTLQQNLLVFQIKAIALALVARYLRNPPTATSTVNYRQSD